MNKKINKKIILLFLCDLIGLYAAAVFTFVFANQSDLLGLPRSYLYKIALLDTGFSLLFLTLLGTYRSIWKYATVKDYTSCFVAVTFGQGSSYFLHYLIFEPVSEVYVFINYILSLCVIIGTRLIYRWFCEIYLNAHPPTEKKRTIIIGAGAGCNMLMLEIEANPKSPYDVICVVDDDLSKTGRNIRGVRIYGPIDSLPELAQNLHAEIVIMAIPSCTPEERRRILQICSKTSCEIRILPFLHEIVADEQLLHQVKNFKIEDLLGRETIRFDQKPLSDFIYGKICMVTGGGGSIGSELCRQIMKYRPAKLIILDIYENNAYDIQQELLRIYPNAKNLAVEIASVRDFKKMDYVMEKYHPNIIFHAAAHKHVPLMETNPEEAVKNNILGTFHVAMLADAYQVDKMVLISTDKAVNPTNVMGATKRCCEMIMQYMAQQHTDTEYVAVRFGNVLGSNGSVIPLFRQQIEAGGPVTVTHKDIIRYFMTIPEAVSLVLQAMMMAHGGEIFVLDMGEPVKITTLAENIIRLYGYEPYSEMEIKFVGLRPGEKLYEELLMDEEGLQSTENKKIFIGNQIQIDEDTFIASLKQLKDIAEENDTEQILDCLAKMVPTFHHETGMNAEKTSKQMKFSDWQDAILDTEA